MYGHHRQEHQYSPPSLRPHFANNPSIEGLNERINALESIVSKITQSNQVPVYSFPAVLTEDNSPFYSWRQIGSTGSSWFIIDGGIYGDAENGLSALEINGRTSSVGDYVVMQSSMNTDGSPMYFFNAGGGGGNAKFALVISCSKTLGLAEIKPIQGSVTLDVNGNWSGDEEVEFTAEIAVNGVEGWHEAGEVVVISPFSGSLEYGGNTYTCKWYISQMVRAIGGFVFPTTGLATTQDTPSVRSYCSDGITADPA